MIVFLKYNSIRFIFRKLFSEGILITKINRSIKDVCENQLTTNQILSESYPNVYFDISINNNPVGRIEFQVKFRNIFFKE
jgi:hypothetical protein